MTVQRLARVAPPSHPVAESVMAELRDAGVIVGEATLFFDQLAKKLRIGSRRLAAAVDRLHREQQLDKLKGAADGGVDNHRYIIGICLRNYRPSRQDNLEIGNHTRV